MQKTPMQVYTRSMRAAMVQREKLKKGKEEDDLEEELSIWTEKVRIGHSMRCRGETTGSWWPLHAPSSQQESQGKTSRLVPFPRDRVKREFVSAKISLLGLMPDMA